jgi:prepilin-type processing-associated H-X9-DG protein
MRRWALVSLAFLLVGAGEARASSATQNACQPISAAGSDYSVCTIDLRRHEVALFWKGPDGEPFGGFGPLLKTPRGQKLVFAMNAGMYKEDGSPVGLYVENGQELKRANTASGPGNFHLKPNGVFFVAGQSAGVLETGRYLRQRPRADYATQSGPMLVIDGQIHPKISENGPSKKIRNGVGVRDRNTVVFAISERPVTFGEFARLFRDELGCANALFLDGSVSSLYAPSLNRNDSLMPLGPIVGALPRG